MLERSFHNLFNYFNSHRNLCLSNTLKFLGFNMNSIISEQSQNIHRVHKLWGKTDLIRNHGNPSL